MGKKKKEHITFDIMLDKKIRINKTVKALMVQFRNIVNKVREIENKDMKKRTRYL